MYARMGDLAEKVTKVLQGSADSSGGSASKGKVLAKIEEKERLEANKELEDTVAE